MKKLKLSSIILSSVLLAASCTKDLTNLNNNPKKPLAVDASNLFANAELSITDLMTNTDVNINIFRLITQQWTQTTYTDESRYDLSTRNIPQNWWHTAYRDVLKDLSEAQKLVTANAALDAGTKKNQLAQIEIVTIYTYAVLVNTFGDIPYGEALDIENLSPEYGEAETIYLDLLTRLDVAIGNLDPASQGFAASERLYEARPLTPGTIASWQKFANSLKMRLGMIVADVDNARAKKAVEEGSANAFTSAADDAIYSYSTIPPNTNPLWVDLVQSGRLDFVGAKTLVDTMNGLSDPRRPFYFNQAPGGGFKGGTPGASNSYSSFSNAGELLRRKDFSAVWIDYTEVEFLRAEAVERGYAVGGTAAQHYTNAVTASIVSWGGTTAQATTYLAQPAVAYTAAGPGGWKGKIGVQKWMALYNRGFEAWTEWRRLDYPQLKPASRAQSAIPLRYTYPVSEQNLNKANYDKAAANIGGDVVTTKMFWDIN